MKRLIAFVLAVFLSGCGYTTGALLPNNIRTLHVESFRNSISLSTSQSYQLQPGIDIDVTNEIVSRYVFDGNVRIAREQKADAVLTGEVVDYIKDPIRFADNNEEVEQYRLTIVVNMQLVDQRNGEIIYTETGFSGDTLYFTEGTRAISEDTALAEAIADLAKNIVDRTVENW